MIGVVRTIADRTPADVHADEIAAIDDLDAILPRLDAVVLATPHTPETEGLLDARRIGLLPERAIVVNIARGRRGRRGRARRRARVAAGCAALRSTCSRPSRRPDSSPFWDLPNVLVSPHSASTVAEENDRIVEIFCENLHAYLAGRPLRNVLDPDLLY